MAYAAYETMIAPARRRPELWRLIATMLTIALVAALLNSAFFRGLSLFIDDYIGTMLGNGAIGATPGSMLILLYSFGLTTVSVIVAVHLWHSRGLLTLIGPPRAALLDFWRAFRMLVLILLIVLLIPTPGGAELVPNLAPLTWALLLPVALAGILVQVSAEEIVFRGYMQQQLAARFRHPAVWMIVPSLFFALGHYDSSQGDTLPYVLAWATLFGLAAADLTARTGNLGAAIALHLANNAFAMLFVAAPDNFSGLALYHLPFSISDLDSVSPYLMLDLVHLLIAWLACRLGLRR